MTSKRRPTRLELLPGMLKGLGRLWAQVTGTAIGVGLLIGPFMPLAVVAFLLTILAPILGLYLWGRALDEQLGWTRDDEGQPW